MFAYAGLVALAAGAVVVRADPTPTAPGPGDVFKQGGQCTFTWDVDTTGTWKEMNVELMTGDNWNMVHLTTIATLDGTDASQTTHSYDCPQVTPNSAIYFYQFTSPSAANRTWTTRFAIGDASGNTTPAPNATQPDGQSIPWGIGKLVDPSTAVAAPSYLTSGSTAATTAGTGQTVVASSGAASGTTAAAGTPAAGTTQAATSSSAAAATPSGTAASSAAANKTNTNTGTGNTTSGSANNGAVAGLAFDGYLVRAAAALGAAAAAFAVVL
ncbi:hypothetical protein C8Q79DRAFT_986700 [Trametes meyenii]|nr:hypothetical protein C8Q79DRAFT_986700 [Trametes meyenii]